ncbi:MAG TPA: hypothetical protein VFT29_00415 [Gemmatimonadaceae bacterium]|nr:hypothetical protein [Gemmatimonadaceae bacterium]
MYGFRVHTQETFRFLRSGGGTSTLEIVTAREPRQRPDVEPFADWTLPGTNHQARATLYRVDGGYEFWTTDVGAFHVDLANGRIEVPDTDDEIAREQRLWGIPLILSYMHREDFSLHAAAVDLGSGAVLFAAPSRYGKTTLALAFHRHGYRLLSEDLVCCRAGESCEVLPGPALVRVRPDVYEGAAPQGMHLVVARPDRVFLALDDDRKGGSAPVPIRGIVFLRESDELRLESVPAPVALPDLWHLNFRLATRQDRARAFHQLARLANRVPCWNVYRPVQLGSLDATVELIAGRLGSD